MNKIIFSKEDKGKTKIIKYIDDNKCKFKKAFDVELDVVYGFSNKKYDIQIPENRAVIDFNDSLAEEPTIFNISFEKIFEEMLKRNNLTSFNFINHNEKRAILSVTNLFKPHIEFNFVKYAFTFSVVIDSAGLNIHFSPNIDGEMIDYSINVTDDFCFLMSKTTENGIERSIATKKQFDNFLMLSYFTANEKIDSVPIEILKALENRNHKIVEDFCIVKMMQEI